MSPAFIHLRVHTEYSLSASLIRIKPLVKAAIAGGMPACAVTDHANLFAGVKFYRAAINAGIKPILGVEVQLADEKTGAVSALVLLVQNAQGYRHVCQLISRCYQQGQTQDRVQLYKHWLNPENLAGLIALSGGREGDIGQALLAGKPTIAAALWSAWQKLLPNRFYLELQRTGRPEEEAYIEAALAFAGQYQIPVVATNDVYFLKAVEFDAHEARVCIHDGTILADPRRTRRYSEQQYFRNAEEMVALFADIPAALANTVEIAKRCNLVLQLGKNFLPDFPVPPRQTVNDYFRSQSEAGLQQRLQQLFADEAQREQQRPRYEQRLQHELQVIQEMGFAGYFLIVADFIRWAKANGVPVGPGRGSGAGSLVAYALQITDLDPLAYELLFERFLNPERVSLPDFDVDFCMEGRDRVIEYVSERYGRARVSQIITYGSMKAKAVIRDVGRVLGHPYSFVDKLAKLIPFDLEMTLEKALAEEVELQQRYQQEEEVKTLFDLAKSLEGIARNAGRHAGGVVIAPSVLTDFAPLYCERGGAGLATQFDKDDVESVGLVKFDFLGLRTLTIIDWTLKTIHQTTGQALEINALPMDDPATFALLKRCETTAIFQLESQGMKALIKRLQPDCFEDIIALVALFRPGPLQSGMVDDFINRKHGRAVIEYPHPDLEPILKPTYGVILYQEQVMQIAQVLAGYTLGGADMLRRAMGKKKPEEMAKQRSIFLDGAAKRGVEASLAGSIFDLMEKFAGYGFNKSHSAAYALLSYQTAWLKAHYPAAFMAAVLSADCDNTDKVVILIEECRAMQLKVLPPAINQSGYAFTVADQRTILYGLGAIKGVGSIAIDLIQAARTQGPFRHLLDICQRVDLGKVNRRVFESLIRAGALDEFGPRAALWEQLPMALQTAEQWVHNQVAGAMDLFGVGEEMVLPAITQKPVAEWPELERLKAEKGALGLYLTGHPVIQYEKELQHFISSRLSELEGLLPAARGYSGGPDGHGGKPSNRYFQREQKVIIAGLIVAVRVKPTQRGKLVFVTLDDRSAQIEVMVYGEIYDTYRDYWQEDQLIIIKGNLSLNETSGGLRISAEAAYTLEQARALFIHAILLELEPGLTVSWLDTFAQCLQPFRGGNCPICLDYGNKWAQARLILGPDWRIHPQDACLQKLESLMGIKKMILEYPP